MSGKRACIFRGGVCSRCGSDEPMAVCQARYALEQAVRALPMTTEEKRAVGYRLRRGLPPNVVARITGVDRARVRAYAACLEEAVLP